MPGNVTSSI